MRGIYKREVKEQISTRLDVRALEQLTKLKNKFGLSKAVILENAINDLYQKEIKGVEINGK